jgi:ATP-binding cassette, subfamily F, member 3
VSQGGVSPFDGDLDDYQKYLLDYAKKQREEAKQDSKNGAKQTVVAGPLAAVASSATAYVASGVIAKKNTGPKPSRRVLDQLEADIAKLSAEKERLQAKLCEPLSPGEIAQTGKRLKEIESTLEPLEEQWLSLSEQFEA